MYEINNESNIIWLGKLVWITNSCLLNIHCTAVVLYCQLFSTSTITTAMLRLITCCYWSFSILQTLNLVYLMLKSILVELNRIYKLFSISHCLTKWYKMESRNNRWPTFALITLSIHFTHINCHRNGAVKKINSVCVTQFETH